MQIKFLQDVDYVNYKKPSMFIGFPKCTFKCGRDICQNVSLAKEPNIEISSNIIAARYFNNPLSRAIVIGGLEPFDSWIELSDFIRLFRKRCDDDIVIYSGYEENEIKEQIEELSNYSNIIIKFGRYIPNDEEHFDPILGVKLASNNQYAKYISKEK